VRLFFALPLPERPRGALAAAAKALCACGADAKWVRPEAMHLTLAFLGEVPPARLDALRRSGGAAASDCPPFRLALRGLGAFPSWERPRVLWAGLSSGADECRRLEAALRRALLAEGFKLEDRPFEPHVTLARLRAPRAAKALAEAAAPWGAPELWPEAERAEAFELVESRLRPEGPDYQTAARFPLGFS